jgi:hypothetical protein
VSPGGSVVEAEINIDGSKPTDSSPIAHQDTSLETSKGVKDASEEPVSADPSAQELPVLEANPSSAPRTPEPKDETPAGAEPSSHDPSVPAPPTPVASRPLKPSLSQRLAALASSRRGSQPSLVTSASQTGISTTPEALPSDPIRKLIPDFQS